MQSSKHAAGVNAALFRALGHPLRGRIMVLLDERVACPTEIAELLEENFDRVARHVREMAKPPAPGEQPLIELVGTDERRGGVQRFYKAVARPVVDLAAWETLSRLLREINSVWVAQILIGDLIEALEARTFDARPGRTMIRMNLLLDEEGWEELEPTHAEYLEKLQDVQAASAERRARSGEKPIKVCAGALAFEMPTT